MSLVPRYKIAMFLGAVALALVFSGCASVTATSSRPLSVYTVNYPLSYFAERIGGERVDVVFPTMDGDPANWAPTAADIAAYQQSDLILLNGAGYAGWTELVSLPEEKTVNTSASFTKRYITEEEESHSHASGDEHTHEAETAFTTWLDPEFAIAQAAAIRDALIARRPAAAEDFEARFESLRSDLRALDSDFATLFGQLGDEPVMFSHPVYQYLERRYALNGESVHWEPDEPPDDSELLRFAERLVAHPALLMIWEGEPSEQSVGALAEMGVASVAFDPCGNRPEQGDYMSVMRDNVAGMRAAWQDLF